MDEQEAITRLRQGDIRGLEILVRKYQLEAVRIAYPITNDLGMAEEVVQSAFLRVYERIGQFDDSRPFRAWFLRIVVNDALKTVKRQKRLVALEPDPDHAEAGPSPTNPALYFEQDEFSSRHDDAELLREVLSTLSPEHRAVLQLKYILDMTDEEIAAVVHIPTGTVKSRLHAAKSKIRSLLKRSNLIPTGAR